MKRYPSVAVLICILFALIIPVTSTAQRKRSTGTRRPATTPKPAPDMRAEAAKITEQINNVTKFIYIYGKIANGLEVAADQAKRGLVTPEVAEQNKKSKEALIANISALRAGVDKVALGFKADSRMQVQYLKLSYATESIANAERLATSGRYDEAGQALVQSIERMMETVLSMRLL